MIEDWFLVSKFSNQVPIINSQASTGQCLIGFHSLATLPAIYWSNTMTLTSEVRKFDLDSRTFEFARQVRRFLKDSPIGMFDSEDKKQLIRSSGSVAANYLEANEALSGKDFSMRIKICRKEARETNMWLRLLADEVGQEQRGELERLIGEALQLVKIFNAISHKVDSRLA